MKQTQLFLLHFAGGNLYSFQFLKPYFQELTFVPLELPGRGKRHREFLLRDFKLAAADIARQINENLIGEYVIYGHSMGAQLALKVAAMMEEMKKPPAYIIVSGSAGPGIRPQKNSHLLEKELLKEELKTLGGLSAEFLENEELFDFYEPIIRADFELVENSKTIDFKTIEIPVYAIMGDEEVYSNEITNWRRFTSSSLDTKLLPGGHFFIHQNAVQLAGIIAKCAARYIQL
jgi:external thioesterase TEII